jgi:heparanase
MFSDNKAVRYILAALVLGGAVACATALPAKPADPLGLSGLGKRGTVDERFQSYNVEMVEVTGGRFWAPYGGPPDEMYRMRPPIDLTNPKLRALARHLGPAYMRVSGTWANSTYLPAEGEQISEPPNGFKQILMRDQWRNVITFAKATNTRIVTSFAASDGVRGPDGAWQPDQAQRLIDLTREAGGTIYAAEMFNEATIPTHGALPPGYGVAEYSRDLRLFKAWAKSAAPTMKLKGTGGVNEGTMMKAGPQTAGRGFLSSADLMKANPGSFDIVSYHYYGSVSLRCKGSPDGAKENALSAGWLDKTLLDFAYYADLRDRFEPGKPIWLNETAQAACGGSPWASTFLDSFRYLNQLGALAQKGVQVVAHNTLAASDYGLIDQDTLTPRPNYWAAVLWNRNMGSTVLAGPQSPSPELRLYAHCLKGRKGGVGILALNVDVSAQKLPISNKALAWVMTGQPIDTKTVLVNGKTPTLDVKGKIIGLEGVAVKAGIEIPGQSIAFVAVSDSGNPRC